MKNLKKLRNEYDASAWGMGNLLNLSADKYLLYEGMKENDIPSFVKARFDNIIEHPEIISDYYKKLEDFYMNNDLKEVFEKSDISYDLIAENLGVGLKTVKEILDEGKPFPNKSTRDTMLDYAMFIDNMYKQNNQQTEPDVEEIKVEPETDILGPEKLPNEVAPEDFKFPELPSTGNIDNDTEGISKDEEIAGLNRQIDWYEELLTCFTHLAELAYKNNK